MNRTAEARIALALPAVVLAVIGYCVATGALPFARAEQGAAGEGPAKTLASTQPAGSEKPDKPPVKDKAAEIVRPKGPIDAGFLFLDGRYIDAPYTVVAKGPKVYVNGICLRTEAGPAHSQPAGDVDPKQPAEVTKNSSKYDKAFIRYIRQKRAFVQRHHTRDEERAIMERVYRNLPFIKEAKLDPKNPNILLVVTQRGQTGRWALATPRRRAGVSPVERARAMKNNLEQRLANGDCYFFFSSGGRISFGRNKTATVLPRVVAILRSQATVEDKLRSLDAAGLRVLSHKPWHTIVTGFSASNQLERRIQEVIDSLAETQPAGGSPTSPPEAPGPEVE